MLDIHRQPDHTRVGVHIDGLTTPVGRLDESAFIDGVVAARKALALVVEAGYFTSQEEKTFQVLYDFDSVDACKIFLAEDDWGELPTDVEAGARELLTGRTGEVLIEEPTRALRLRRLS